VTPILSGNFGSATRPHGECPSPFCPRSGQLRIYFQLLKDINMKLVHCDSCGMTEPNDVPAKKRQILEVSLAIVKDSRAPEGTDKHKADLCPNCRGMMLHTYFKVRAEGKLEVPAFIGPKVVIETPEPSSLRSSP
jgi:hypothetical protein